MTIRRWKSSSEELASRQRHGHDTPSAIAMIPPVLYTTCVGFAHAFMNSGFTADPCLLARNTSLLAVTQSSLLWRRGGRRRTVSHPMSGWDVNQ